MINKYLNEKQCIMHVIDCSIKFFKVKCRCFTLGWMYTKRLNKSTSISFPHFGKKQS